MTRIVLTCSGVPLQHGEEAARDIAQEFREHRPWWNAVECTWNGSLLRLAATSDFDHDGAALNEEFSDCIAAYVPGVFSSHINVDSIDTSLSA
jgi:hypothetical protein